MLRILTNNLVIIWCLLFGICPNVFAANLDLAKTHFLQGDYGTVISDCQGIIKSKPRAEEEAQAYYFLGQSYLKLQDSLKAKEAFNFILDNFKGSAFAPEAFLGMASAYLQEGDFSSAAQTYEIFLRTYPKSNFLSSAYFGLGRSLLKQGRWQEAKENFLKVQQEYPLSFEAKLAKDLLAEEFYFTVQVGSFAKEKNAQSLCQQLKDKGLESFIQEEDTGESVFYRVRVGKFSLRPEAEDLKKQLAEQGYPARIFP